MPLDLDLEGGTLPDSARAATRSQEVVAMVRWLDLFQRQCKLRDHYFSPDVSSCLFSEGSYRIYNLLMHPIHCSSLLAYEGV